MRVYKKWEAMAECRTYDALQVPSLCKNALIGRQKALFSDAKWAFLKPQMACFIYTVCVSHKTVCRE